MTSKLFTVDQILERTAAGQAAMQQRAQNVSPKLRAVLYLIDGERTLAQLLDGVGSMADLISSQVDALGQLGLLRLKERRQAPRKDPMSARELAEAMALRAANAEPRNMPVSNFFNASQFGENAQAEAKPSNDAMHPLMGAKMELLGLLEKIQVDKIEVLAASLLEPKNLKDLAFKAKQIADQLEPMVGITESQAFWTAAKVVLLNWRNQSG